MSQLGAIQARLSGDAVSLQAEIDSLREDLQKHQDPQRMQLIQEMIAVCAHEHIAFHVLCSESVVLVGSYEPNVSNTRTSNRIRGGRTRHH